MVAATQPSVIRERTCLHTYLSSISLPVIDLFLMLCLMLFEKLGRGELIQRRWVHVCVIVHKTEFGKYIRTLWH